MALTEEGRKLVDEIIAEAHLDPESLAEGIKLFSADREKRLRLMGHVS